VQHTGGDSITATAGGLSSSPAGAQTIRLSFNHPVKELIWCYTNTTSTAYNSLWNFSTSAANVNVTCGASPFLTGPALPHTIGAPRLFSNALAQIGTFSAALTSNIGWVEEGSSNVSSGTQVEVGPLYNFKLVLNGQDRFKEQQGKYFNQYQPYVYHSGVPYPGIYVYSFALQPEEHQPTGTCNFSRIDNAQVAINMKGNYTTPLQKMFAVNYNILRIQSGMGGLAFSN
jgi:Large eukaryotic DNA virus major capsid protein